MAEQTRPEPMNASPHHPKVRTTLKFAESQFVAGGVVAGKMEMECKADKGLGIGVIMVELFAIEELTSRDHSATSSFLHCKRIFQGPGLPPSNAVQGHQSPGDPPLPQTYFPARRGTTTFLFRLPLPPTTPSSINFGSGLANVRYEVRASVGVYWKGDRRLVTDKKEVDVVESFQEDYIQVEPQVVIVAEGGKIWAQARVVGGFLLAGQAACVELHVKNHSTKKNSGLSVTLTRDLGLPNYNSPDVTPLQISDSLTSVSFRGQDYIISPGVEGVANLVFDVPAVARGVKGGLRQGSEEEGQKTTPALFEVRCVVGVKISMPIGSKDIQLELPVTILNQIALPVDLPPPESYPLPPIPPVLDSGPFDVPSPLDYVAPRSPVPYLSPAPPLPPPLFSPPPPHLIQQPWLQQNIPHISQHAYSPHLQAHIQPYYPHPPHIPLSPPPHLYQHHQHHIIPLRPSSAEPVHSQPLYEIPAGLPLSSIQQHQPLIPLATGGQPLISVPFGGGSAVVQQEREEGKGERASRISQHLRMSSRHRSVSPQAHRYPVQLSSIPEAQPSYPTVSPAIPSSRPVMHLDLPPPEVPLVSPRPMLSPKQSFTVDPLTRTTLTKSERVETLERMAAAADRENKDMSSGTVTIPSGSSPLLLDEDQLENNNLHNKTLPVPPVPTKVISAMTETRPRVDTLFVDMSARGPAIIESPDENTPVLHPHLQAAFKETPRTPTLAAVMSLKVPQTIRAAAGGGLSGLDALEARLLAEVGTRKVEQDDLRPDVRSVISPIPIPKPINGPSQAPVIDSAISSLNLPGVGEEEMEMHLNVGGEKAGSNHSGGARTERGRGRGKRSDVGIGGGTTPEPPNPSKEKKEKKSGKKQKERMSEDKEAYQMRKAARGRVAAWLDALESPSPSSPPRPLSPPTPIQTPPDLLDDLPAHHPRSPPMDEVTPEEGISIAALPNPRSSGFVPIETIRANRLQQQLEIQSQKPDEKIHTPTANVGGMKLLAAFSPPKSLNREVRYDIRSARGGRGGKVTAIASIWAQAATKLPPVEASPPPIVKPSKTKHVKPSPAQVKLPSPVKLPPLTPTKPIRPSPSKAAAAVPRAVPDDVPNISSKRAKGIKSTSVPAVVSASLATPMLSTTASLARPSPALDERMKLNNKLPPIASSESKVTKLDSNLSPSRAKTAVSPLPTASTGAKSLGDMAFGQARLRELIKRYQGQS